MNTAATARIIRLAVALPSLGGGGAERVAVTLMRLLDPTRFEPVLILADSGHAALRSHLPPHLKIIDLKTPKISLALPGFVRAIWRLRPDVVFSTLDHLNIALAASRPLWPPRTGLVVRPTLMPYARTRLERALMRTLYPLADRVVLQSPEMEADFRRSIGGSSSLLTIPNPVDFDEIRHSAADPNVDPGYEPSSFNLVAAGRLEHQKGFDVLIEALTLLDAGVTLTILGDGSERRALEECALANGVSERLRITGFVSNPYPYIALADCFVLSSRYEGFPNVVLEAIACGTAVATTPVDGIARLLSGRTGFEVASSFEAPALADAIRRTITRGRLRFPPVAANEHAAPAVVGRYDALFCELTSSMKPRKVTARI